MHAKAARRLVQWNGADINYTVCTSLALRVRGHKGKFISTHTHTRRKHTFFDCWRAENHLAHRTQFKFNNIYRFDSACIASYVQCCCTYMMIVGGDLCWQCVFGLLTNNCKEKLAGLGSWHLTMIFRGNSRIVWCAVRQRYKWMVWMAPSMLVQASIVCV